MNNSNGAIYDARSLGTGKMLILGFQHMFAMFGATVLVPALTGLNVATTLLFAGLGFVLCIPLASLYGAIGVAIGTCVNSFLVTNIYDNWYYYKAGKLDVVRFFRNFSVFLPAVLVVLLSVNILIYLFPVSNWLDFAAVITCFLLLYCVIMYTLGMNSSERMQVKKIIRRCSF